MMFPGLGKPRDKCVVTKECRWEIMWVYNSIYIYIRIYIYICASAKSDHPWTPQTPLFMPPMNKCSCRKLPRVSLGEGVHKLTCSILQATQQDFFFVLMMAADIPETIPTNLLLVHVTLVVYLHGCSSYPAELPVVPNRSMIWFHLVASVAYQHVLWLYYVLCFLKPVESPQCILHDLKYYIDLS